MLVAAGLTTNASAASPRDAAAAPATAQTVHFTAADGRTELVAYLFEPAGTGPHPRW
jgi:hypothetical protein